MNKKMFLLIFPILLLTTRGVCGQRPSPADSLPPSAGRIGLSAGMGVLYVGARDISDFINSHTGVVDRVPEFKSAVEFFGAGVVPLSERWDLKLEYAYMLASYNLSTSYSTGDFSLVTHMPSVIVQYVLMNEGVYNVKAGLGGGFHFGTLTTNFYAEKDSYTSTGGGAVLEMEANTAFGEHVFVFLGANARWEFLSGLKNAGGRSPGISASGTNPTPSFFGVGARMGLTYYF